MRQTKVALLLPATQSARPAESQTMGSQVSTSARTHPRTNSSRNHAHWNVELCVYAQECSASTRGRTGASRGRRRWRRPWPGWRPPPAAPPTRRGACGCALRTPQPQVQRTFECVSELVEVAALIMAWMPPPASSIARCHSMHAVAHAALNESVNSTHITLAFHLDCHSDVHPQLFTDILAQLLSRCIAPAYRSCAHSCLFCRAMLILLAL